MLEKQQKASKELGQAVPPLYPQQLLGAELLEGASVMAWEEGC